MRKFSIFLALAIVLMVVIPQVCATISETVHSSSVTKKVGVTSELGSPTDTHASDNKYHYSRISSNRGYLDYSFISSYTDCRIEKLEYKTELKIGSIYESVSVQIWNWKTLKWETLWGDLHHMSEQKHTYTITNSPWNYVDGNTGEIRIRYYYYQHQPPRVWVDHQSITVEADKTKPSLSPKEPHFEEIHASSKKKYGVTSEMGDYQKTYVSDNSYHYFRVGNLHGSLEYEFTTANTNHKLVKLQYQTEPKIGSIYESVSVQIWNWKTLNWEILWGDLHHMSEHVHTWETTSTNYLSKEGHVRIRYYYHQHQPPRVWIDYQRLMFYFDTTQSGEYPSEFDPCEEHFESSSDETRVGVTSELGDHTRTYVSDNSYHYFRVGNSGGYLVYDFKTGIKTSKESTPEDYLSNSVLKRVGVTSELGDHTGTHVSDNSYHYFRVGNSGGYLVYNFKTGIKTRKSIEASDEIYSSSVVARNGISGESGTHANTHKSDNNYHYFRIGSNRGYLVYEFNTGYNPDDVKKLRYRTEPKIGSIYESVSVQIWNWKTLRWETLWGDLHHMSERVHTWDTMSSDYLSAGGKVRIRYYYYRHQPPRVWIDHQYVQVWTETESGAIDPDVNKLRYRTELKIGSIYESVSVEAYNWKTLKWETLWGDLHHMSEQVHTWDTISLDYLSAEGDMRIRYYYYRHQPPRVWIDHQYVQVWMGTTSGNYDPGIVKMQYPAELKIGSIYESVSVEVWNWKTLKWETLWGDLHNMGERIHTYTWETGSMEDYLNADGDMKIRYYYHQHQPPRVWNDFQEIIIWWPCKQTTTTTITTTTITTTTITTTTTSTTSTIPTAHTFTYNATDDHSITSCSLWTDISGSWQIDQTDEIIINGATDSFTVINTPYGTYKWNVECVDDATQSAFAFNAPHDWTFTVS